MSPFQGRFARHYNALYAEKDYVAEADYIAARLRGAMPAAGRLLEFGSGTGRHARILSRQGFEIVGIEQSAEMLAQAELDDAEAVRFVLGDMRTSWVPGAFDCVLALFHVLSYLPLDEDLKATLQNARRHLSAGGLFLFDVWYGPAVLAQGAQVRVKEVGGGGADILRIARPSLEVERNLVHVGYTIFERETGGNLYGREDESHVMRYFFLDELASLLASEDFRMLDAEESFTGNALNMSTWGAMILAQAL